MSKNLFKPVYFDLDGICQFQIYGQPALAQAVRRELSFYQIDPQNPPITLDLEIELNHLSRYQKSKNPPEMPPFDFPGRHKLARWVIRFERLAQPPRRIKFYGNAFSKMIVAKQMVEPALRWLAQPLGFIWVHSTCLVKEGRGILIAGQGGTGKTRLLLNWLKQGNPFLSDDFTILSFGKARRYVTPLRIGARLLLESGLSKNLTASRKTGIYLRTAIRKILFNYAHLQAKLELQELLPGIQIVDQVDLSAAVVIEGDGPGLKKISPLEMAEKLVEINKKEMYGFADYLPQLSEKTGDKNLAQFFITQRGRLLEFLKDLPCYQIPLLRNYRSKDLLSLLEQLSFLLNPASSVRIDGL